MIKRGKTSGNRSAPYGRPGTITSSNSITGASTALNRGGSSLAMEHKFGQHLLRNPGILDKMMEAANIQPHDVVMEIGPGTGNLTDRLLERAKQVIAIEVDGRMAAEVKKRAQDKGRSHKFKLIEGDCLKIPFPAFNVCVTNLPYNISSPFVFKLLTHRPLFRCAVVMFQKEFAERLVAQVGDPFYGRLAVNVQLYCKVFRVCKVDRKSFNPPPEVDSMVVRFVPHEQPIDVPFNEFDGLLRICFSRKNKTIRSSFLHKKVLKLIEINFKILNNSQNIETKKIVETVLTETGLSEMRAAKISLDGYIGLLLAFNRRGIHFSNVNNEATVINHDDDEEGMDLDD
jgi:18S rRNA (adenine1779-N6/adenine1780-N6)-dimethyltransferase